MLRVAVDCRSLQTSPMTGVGSYLYHILKRWNAEGVHSSIHLYSNEFRKREFPEALQSFMHTHTAIPNILLQTLWMAQGAPSLKSHISEPVIWLPNINFLGATGTKKIVLSIHDLSFLDFPQFYTKKMNLWHKMVNIESLIKRTSKIITFSEAIKRDILRHFDYNEKNIYIVPHGVDFDFYQNSYTTKTLTLPNRYIAFVGSLEPRKNIDTLIEAFEIVAKKDESIQLVIAGSKGWLSKHTIKRFSASEVSNRITYLGYISDVEKAMVLQNADAFVFPSLYEGFGLPLLEAMAAGCPIITSPTGAIPEVVSSAALMVSPYQTQELASAITMLLTSEVMQDELRQKGIKRALEHSWKDSAKHTYDIVTTV